MAEAHRHDVCSTSLSYLYMVVFEFSTGKRCMLGAASGENVYCVNLLGKVCPNIYNVVVS